MTQTAYTERIQSKRHRHSVLSIYQKYNVTQYRLNDILYVFSRLRTI